MTTTSPADELATLVAREMPAFRERWADPGSWEARLDWQRTLQRERWAAPAWPEEHGGRGLSTLDLLACEEVLAAHGAPLLPGILGLKNVGPTLIAYGDERQRAHLPRILSGEEIWCQGFSEPGAGSDLAGLRTRAERDGDSFVVNGQKTWTSSGMHATHMELLARTDPDARKHHGISALEMDMSTPGIEVRPIRMITGEAEFAEVFFTDVRVPAQNLIGPLNGGWGVAVATLGHERAGVAAMASRLAKDVTGVVEEQALAGPLPAVLADDLLDVWVECQVAALLGDQMLARLGEGQAPGPEQSVIKLVWSEASQRASATRLSLGGLAALDDGTASGTAYDYLQARQMTIVAGTTQIVKNLIAERILGLPVTDTLQTTSGPATSEADRREFRLAVRRFLSERSTESDVRRLGDDPLGYDPVVWRQLAGELGLPGLLVPDEHGGQGLTLAELAVALEEVGRALLPGPVLSCAVLAPAAVLATGDADAATRLLRPLVEGVLVVAVALDGGDAGVSAHEQGGGWSLTGTVHGVLDAHVADRLLVVAGAGSELGLFEVDRTSAVVQPRRSLDLTTWVATVTLTGSEAARVGGRFDQALTKVRDVAAVAASAQLVGIGDAALRIAVDYALAREQFGRPIGSYQGVKHLCADMHSRQECSRAVLAAAAEATDEALPRQAALAKAWCSSAGVKVVEDCIQVLGGIGFTWEHPAHLLLRRAKLMEALYGDARHHRATLAQQFGLATS